MKMETFYAIEWKNLKNENGRWYFVADEEDEIRRYDTAEKAKNRILSVREKDNAYGFSIEYRIVKVTKEVVG